jgi:ATP-binding cassette subfamily F protein uup
LPPILNAQGLSKSFGAAPLFENVWFTVGEGDRIGLIGPNGSGKSTLLQILIGRVPPDSGEIAVRKLARLSYIAQESQFAPGESVRSIIQRALGAASVPRAEWEGRVAETLGRVGFDDFNMDATALSGGWRKRLVIA